MKKRLIALLLILVIMVPCLASAETWYRLTEKKRIFNLPDYNSRVIDTYRTDWALTINSVSGDWALITFSNGVSGYVERKAVVIGRTSTAWISQQNTHLKHGPGSGFANEGTFSLGDSVTVITRGSNWSYVSSSRGNGYVSNNALSSSKVSPSAGPSYKSVNYTAWIVSRGDPVGLRSAPSGSNDVVLQTYYPGSKLTVLKECGEFNYVRMAADGHEGYMRSRYMSRTKPAQAFALEQSGNGGNGGGGNGSTVSVPADPSFPFTAYARSSGGEKPKLFRGEGLGWDFDTLEPGTTITVTGRATDIYWYKVTVNGKAGYMPGKFFGR